MWKGQLTFESPMLFSIGFLITFLFGGLSGVILASPPLDFHVTDSVLRRRPLPLRGLRYGRVRHVRRYLLLVPEDDRSHDGRAVSASGTSGPRSSASTARSSSSTGSVPKVCRVVTPDYLPSDGFTVLNSVSTIFAFVLGASTLPFIWNVFKSYRYGEVVTVDDPWGYGNSLEWATTCPPPRHNFTELPRIRSERPAFELHYPHMVERMRAEAHVGLTGQPTSTLEKSDDRRQID